MLGSRRVNEADCKSTLGGGLRVVMEHEGTGLSSYRSCAKPHEAIRCVVSHACTLVPWWSRGEEPLLSTHCPGVDPSSGNNDVLNLPSGIN